MFDMRVIILKFWKVYLSNTCMGRKNEEEEEEGGKMHYLGHRIIFSMD